MSTGGSYPTVKCVVKRPLLREEAHFGRQYGYLGFAARSHRDYSIAVDLDVEKPTQETALQECVRKAGIVDCRHALKGLK